MAGFLLVNEFYSHIYISFVSAVEHDKDWLAHCKDNATEWDIRSVIVLVAMLAQWGNTIKSP